MIECFVVPDHTFKLWLYSTNPTSAISPHFPPTIKGAVLVWHRFLATKWTERTTLSLKLPVPSLQLLTLDIQMNYWTKNASLHLDNVYARENIKHFYQLQQDLKLVPLSLFTNCLLL